MNSVDASTSDSVEDTLTQISLIAAAGIDFIEISGGTYENPRMMAEPAALDHEKDTKSARTAARESFFLTFSTLVRARFPKLVLMVTGYVATSLLCLSPGLDSLKCILVSRTRAHLSPFHIHTYIQPN
jgi:hypothetical protein